MNKNIFEYLMNIILFFFLFNNNQNYINLKKNASILKLKCWVLESNILLIEIKTYNINSMLYTGLHKKLQAVKSEVIVHLI